MLLRQCHTLLVEALLAHLLNLAYTLHGLQRLGHQLAVVLHRSVARLLKLKRRVNANVLSVRASERLRPSHLSRIASQIEVLSALGAAETEHFTVVTDKHNSMSGINRTGAKVARFYSHPS